MRRPLALALLVAAAGPAAALGDQRSPDQRADLDGDGAAETIQVRGADEPFAPRRAVVQTSCGDVALLRREHDLFVEVDIVEGDGDRARPELLVEGRSGAAGRVGEIALVRFDRDARGCARPRHLFRHPGQATRRPRGAAYSATGTVRLARDGRHLTLRQGWYRRADGDCCPTWIATAHLAYDARGQRYVRTHQTVHRTRR
ncbi:MAG TPA: hypothetical protein VD931_19810 [Baekduia sp.]|nr:hypothetical protein [Baekduia sp.]